MSEDLDRDFDNNQEAEAEESSGPPPLYSIYYIAELRGDMVIPFYVGVTTRYVNIRISEHISRACDGDWKGIKDLKIKELCEAGARPIIGFIDVARGREWMEKEQYWIGYFNQLLARFGLAPLLNESSGGIAGTGRTHSEETKSKIAESVREFHASEKG